MIENTAAYLTCSTSCVTPCCPEDDPVSVRSTHGLKPVCGPFPDGPYTRHEQSEARELADALDLYKLVHRRYYLTFEEVIGILRSLGYVKR